MQIWKFSVSRKSWHTLFCCTGSQWWFLGQTTTFVFWKNWSSAHVKYPVKVHPQVNNRAAVHYKRALRTAFICTTQCYAQLLPMRFPVEQNRWRLQLMRLQQEGMSTAPCEQLHPNAAYIKKQEYTHILPAPNWSGIYRRRELLTTQKTIQTDWGGGGWGVKRGRS